MSENRKIIAENRKARFNYFIEESIECGIALEGTGEDAKLGSAGLIMAILGGSILPPLQAAIIDAGTVLSMPAVNVSFILPLICFVVISIYGMRMSRA